MFRHLIFDFDGTISDSYPWFVKVIHRLSEEYHIPLPVDDVAIDRALRHSVGYAFEMLKWNEKIPGEQLVTDFRRVKAEYIPFFRAFPEAVALLKNAAKNGKKLYLYTHSGKEVEKMLCDMGIGELFTFVLDSTYGFPPKPAPDALLFFIQKFDLDPTSCLMIGDRPIDAHAGMRAGMKGCLWDPDFLYPDAQVDFRVRKLQEIETFID